MKISKQMIKYLEDRINCENVIKFADKHFDDNGDDDNASIQKLIVDDVSMSFVIMDYSEKNANTFTKTKYQIYDFMTEANYTGFEIFPYLYGVLNCHDNNNGRLYVYYEVFQNNMTKIFDNITHASDWYDIAFQMIYINYYIRILHGYIYDGDVQNHQYNKLDKPYYKDYEFNNTTIKVNHKYLIVLFNVEQLERISDSNAGSEKTNIDMLLQYISENKDNIKIMPTNRIMELLNEVKESPDNTANILVKYYGDNK